ASNVTVNSETSITATSPKGKGTVDVTVTTSGGTSATGEHDRFIYGVTVRSISPGSGPEVGGTQVTVTGTGFIAGASVKFGGVPASKVTVNSETSITATSPKGKGTVDVTVTTSEGTSPTGEHDRFTYATAPTVTSISPKSGPEAGGTSVTITGTGFIEGASVRFGSEPALKVTINSVTSITATSPKGSGTLDVTVTTSKGTSATSEQDQFTYEKAPVVTSTPTVSPPSLVIPITSARRAPVPAPKLAVSANIVLVAGRVLMRLPGTSKSVAVSSLRQIPFGTIIDATNGAVDVITAGPHGGTQTGEFFDGRFVLTQARNGLVLATLSGGNFLVCPTARERRAVSHTSSRRTSRKHLVRRLWANVGGSFSTKGSFATGAVQGSEWLTEDLCEGTVILAVRNRVKVTDLVRHREVELSVGHIYLAKAR
ncbi:MAG: IPT/TIG domain-containing protein, partial [Solirubrobacteraceae bacterium]